VGGRKRNGGSFLHAPVKMLQRKGQAYAYTTAIGIDIGGTNIRIALVDASGALVGINKQPTDAGREMHQILGDIAQGIGRLMSTHKVPGRNSAA